VSDYNGVFNWKTEDEIREDIFNEGKTRIPSITNYNTGGVWRTFLEIVAFGLGQLYALLSNVIRQAYIQYATGGWLDLKVGTIGLVRYAATKVSGTVYFTRSGTLGNYVIPAGTIIRTPIDSTGNSYRFLTTEEVILADGTAEISAPVTGEFEGAAYNVGTGIISEMVSVVGGVEAVENRDGWIISEGTDIETDDALRERYWLRWEEMGRG